MNPPSVSDLASGPPLPHLEREHGPGEQLMTSEHLAGSLRDAARECDYQALRLEGPALRRLAAVSGTLIRHLAQVAEAPVEPVAVSTWFVVSNTPEFVYEGTRDNLTLTLTAGADTTTQLTFRIDLTVPVLDRLDDLLECARTEYYRDNKEVETDLYRHANAAPGHPGVPNTTVTLGRDTLMNFEVDPVHDIVHLYFGPWNTPNSSALRLDIRDPRTTLDALLDIVRRINGDLALLRPHQHHFIGPRTVAVTKSD